MWKKSKKEEKKEKKAKKAKKNRANDEEDDDVAAEQLEKGKEGCCFWGTKREEAQGRTVQKKTGTNQSLSGYCVWERKYLKIKDASNQPIIKLTSQAVIVGQEKVENARKATETEPIEKKKKRVKHIPSHKKMKKRLNIWLKIGKILRSMCLKKE